jgi:hypothetical protein
LLIRFSTSWPFSPLIHPSILLLVTIRHCLQRIRGGNNEAKRMCWLDGRLGFPRIYDRHLVALLGYF